MTRSLLAIDKSPTMTQEEAQFILAVVLNLQKERIPLSSRHVQLYQRLYARALEVLDIAEGDLVP